MKRIVLFSIIGLLLFLLFVYESFIGYFRYGKSFNEERIRLGVPVIGDDFRHSDNFLTWYNPEKSYPRHSMKIVTVDGFSIKIEHDNFQIRDDTTIVTLFSYYHYDEDCYNFYIKRPPESSSKISCKEFLDVLRSSGYFIDIDCSDCDKVNAQ